MLSKGAFEEYKARQNEIDMKTNMLKINSQNKFEDYMTNVFAPWGLQIVIAAHIFVILAVVLSFWK
jgi:hypothetical protein